MKRFLFTLGVASTLLLSACSPFRSVYQTGSSNFDSVSGYTPADDYAYAPSYESVKSMDGGAGYSDIQERKVIKTGSLSLHVQSVQDSIVSMTQLIEGMEGSVQSSNVTRGNNSYSGTMTVKVPSDQFDAALVALKDQADYVSSEYTNASDVTEYYTDLETRLSNKQAEEQQYLAVLEKATTVSDILSVDQYLSNVRYEIESLQGQLKSYDSQIDYSTITLYLTEDESISTVSETWKPVSTVKTAVSDWIVFLQGTVDGMIYFVIFCWPLVIVLLIVRSWLRKRRKSSKR